MYFLHNKPTMTSEKKKKILIAEDEQPMAHALELKLQHSGYEAKAVFDGQQALDELKKEKYDLILSDLVMPVVDGFGVLAALQEQGSKLPVIVSSNLGQPEDIARAKKLGAADYFVKADTSINDVVEHVKRFLG